MSKFKMFMKLNFIYIYKNVQFFNWNNSYLYIIYNNLLHGINPQVILKVITQVITIVINLVKYCIVS